MKLLDRFRPKTKSVVIVFVHGFVWGVFDNGRIAASALEEWIAHLESRPEDIVTRVYYVNYRISQVYTTYLSDNDHDLGNAGARLDTANQRMVVETERDRNGKLKSFRVK